MAESVSFHKTGLKTKKSNLQRHSSMKIYGSTPLNETNGRITFPSSNRLQKITSTSLEGLSFISEKDSCISSDLENYELEYSTYLLRKVQNKVLSKSQEERVEKVKKCFVSLKWELEELLQKFVTLSKNIAHFKGNLEVIKQTDQRIETGKSILKVLKDNNFDSLMESLTRFLGHFTNKLQLVDIEKHVIDDMFEKSILGPESEVEKFIEKIHASLKKNKEKVSEIAEVLSQLEKLYSEISILRSRYFHTFDTLSNEIIEKNYSTFVNPIVSAFKKREELNLSDCEESFDEGFLDVHEIVHPALQNASLASSLQFSKFESSCPVMPHSSSTPTNN